MGVSAAAWRQANGYQSCDSAGDILLVQHYSRGKGLFGKLPGLYWWESHVRGSADSGLVRKEYAVAAPGASQEDRG